MTASAGDQAGARVISPNAALCWSRSLHTMDRLNPADALKPITDDGLRVLAGWAPILTSPDFDIGHWVVSEPDEDGVTQMPWFDYSPDALRLMAEVAGAGFVQPFDWMTWMGSPDAKVLVADPGRVAAVDADDLRRLLTAIVRGDRFMEGNVAGAFESGMLLAIARRAGSLLQERGRAR